MSDKMLIESMARCIFSEEIKGTKGVPDFLDIKKRCIISRPDWANTRYYMHCINKLIDKFKINYKDHLKAKEAKRLEVNRG